MQRLQGELQDLSITAPVKDELLDSLPTELEEERKQASSLKANMGTEYVHDDGPWYGKAAGEAFQQHIKW